MRRIIFAFVLIINFSCCNQKSELPVAKHNLVFDKLTPSWDEGIPLGNGMLGALVWQKGSNLRFSLDRVDLWDLRPMENINKPEFSFDWVQQQVKNNNYKTVQEMFDKPYDESPAPSKIPGAALEFNIQSLGKVKQVKLTLENALCEVFWQNGITLKTFIHASEPVGWFRFKGISEEFIPVLVPPEYEKPEENSIANPVSGQDLQRLGYEQGIVTEEPGQLVYRQRGWNGFEYEVAVAWELSGGTLTGVWSISSSFSDKEGEEQAHKIVGEQLKEKIFTSVIRSHSIWWKEFWDKSSITLPDKILEKQWYLEQYKFGSVARQGAPPISLQAVWTADNGKLPPWKGDFHHDLNTQLSYWPAYSSNHIDLEEGFIDWLWKYTPVFKKYTKDYFGTNGLNVPGVTTITGEPMGGWIQYSLGPTIGCWLAQHFYLHWVYSKDEKFLQEKAYPWIRDVAVYLDEISVKDSAGVRRLPLSSSPEIHDNSINAWFFQTTNFDLSFILWTYKKATELARELGKTEEAARWEKMVEEWPGLALDSKGGLAFAPNHPYKDSHRHFSHLVGWHPLGNIDWSNGREDRKIIRSTLKTLEEVGTEKWCGYSFSWLGNLYARAFMGNKAAESLRIFSQNFCLPNSFHCNGDQSGKGFSNFTYRPFTLEGNFACAAGIQEMLLQSHTGVIHIFPAIPDDWKNVSFSTFRSEGAFLVSAWKKNGEIEKLEIFSKKGGICRLKNPFSQEKFHAKLSWDGEIKSKNGFLVVKFPPNEKVELFKR